MGRRDKADRVPLRVRLQSPGWQRAFRALRWVFGLAAGAGLVLLALTVITQPADRAFTRPEEWLALGLLALPCVLILLALLIRALRRRKR